MIASPEAACRGRNYGGYWGPQSKKKVDFHFDDTREIAQAQMDDWNALSEKKLKARERKEAVKAQIKQANAMPAVMACGGGPATVTESCDKAPLH